MSDDQTSTDSLNADGRPKRSPPTIDLDASEVSEQTDGAQADSRHVWSMPRWLAVGLPVISAVVGALAAVGMIWSSSWLVRDATPTSESQQLSATLAELSGRIARIESKPSTPAAPAPDGEMRARLEAHEAALNAVRSDVTALRKQTEAAMAAGNDLNAAPHDLSALTERLARLEQAVRALPREFAAPAGDDKELKRVVVANVLEGKVQRGEPFADTLAAAKTLTPDATGLAPLETFAATGVPTDGMLAKELLALLPQLAPASAPTTSDKPASGNGGLLDRLASGASKLVHVERADAPDSLPRDVGGSLRAIADAARRNDLAAARNELAKLRADLKSRAQPWLDRVTATDAARKAAGSFSSSALAALSKPAN
jgi:hypothetical protein